MFTTTLFCQRTTRSVLRKLLGSPSCRFSSRANANEAPSRLIIKLVGLSAVSLASGAFLYYTFKDESAEHAVSDKRVVILGGGYAGAASALKLQHSFDVTLIDNKDHFLFTPSIVRLLTEPAASRAEHLKRVLFRHADYLRRGRFIQSHATEVRPDRVVLRDGSEVPFDYLLVATGSRYEQPWKLTDSSDFHGTADEHVRRLDQCADALSAADSVVIVGGGPVGVELAGALVNTPSLSRPERRVALVHGHDRLLQHLPPKAGALAQEFLEERGVRLLLNTRMVSALPPAPDPTSSAVRTSAGDVLSGQLFLCSGIRPNPDFMRKHFGDLVQPNGTLPVNDCLQLLGHRNIFVLGDISNIPDDMRYVVHHVDSVVDNVRRLDSELPLQPCHVPSPYKCLSLGVNAGLLRNNDSVYSGRFPALMKKLAEFLLMRQFVTESVSPNATKQ
eukprot:TRINITY_DN6726_c0_g1_i1.p1 TRINITY_DN6726_c0_g1~~TRINITY_DN6726_c0_g1_i1.p1  ORF type:complete len:446 (-),score=48.39 TRINITY_DN6726_c0_g1_i1:162-1499(-)